MTCLTVAFVAACVVVVIESAFQIKGGRADTSDTLAKLTAAHAELRAISEEDATEIARLQDTLLTIQLQK
jgi:hypothetical protein